MAQQNVTSWINTPVPGAYVQTKVINNSSGLATSGVMVIMGEAAGGPDYSVATLANNFYGPSALNQVTSIYTSGPIVDAFRALTAPSNDQDITGSANSIYIIKTNKGAKASASIAAHSAAYGTLSALNWGVGGNLFNFSITSLDAEVPPSVTGTTIPSYAGLSGAAFSVRMNGGVSTIVTPLGTITNVTTLVTSLNAAFTAVSVALVASPGLAANTITIGMPVDAAAYSEGFGKAFELIDSTPGDLAALGLVAGLVTSSQEPAIEVQVINSTTGVNELLPVAPVVALQVGYEGTTATMTINSTTLTTTVTGGAGANLSITLAQYTTVSQLAAFINSQPGYSAICNPAAISIPPSALDQVVAAGICSTANVLPGRIKNSIYAFEQELATSTAVGFTATAVAGLPDPAPVAYLAGGLLGPTLAADIVNCIAQLAGIQVNIIVPLFSQNASVDIAEGNTDPGSTYTINAINELVKSHCIEYSTPTLKRNRIAVCSIWDTYANAKIQAQTLASYRVSLAFQKVVQINSSGVNTTFLPWYGAVVAASMQCAAFYKSICNHYVNLISYVDPVGYDSGDPADVSDALYAGMLALTQDTGGIREVSDQTTYGLDSNFVYNSIQAVYLSDILSLDLAQYFQQAVVGKSVADISASSALGLLQQRFNYYYKLKMVSSSNNAPLGYTNAAVQISAPSMYIQVQALLTTSIYFVDIELALSAVQQSASG